MTDRDALSRTTPASMSETETAVRAALAAQGFGILTEIDVAATLKAKLGVERPAMRILGACNPGFAHRALELDEAVSLLLPCNVVLADTGAGTRVTIADPRLLMGDDPAFAALAEEAAERLREALEALDALDAG